MAQSTTTPAGGRPAESRTEKVPEHPKPLEPADPDAIQSEPGSLAHRDPAEGTDEEEGP